MNQLASLIGPMKSKPHLVKCSISKMVINFVKLCIDKLPVLSHKSQEWQ
jgi:hypothetical protein